MLFEMREDLVGLPLTTSPLPPTVADIENVSVFSSHKMRTAITREEITVSGMFSIVPLSSRSQCRIEFLPYFRLSSTQISDNHALPVHFVPRIGISRHQEEELRSTPVSGADPGLHALGTPVFS